MNNLLNVDSNITDELDEIIEAITDKTQVSKIILFGSFAYGNPKPDSDIDLCVITNDNRRKIEILREIYTSIFDAVKHSIDILVYKPDEFLDRANSVSTIEKTISNKGIVMYG